jgi:hypothetical protein
MLKITWDSLLQSGDGEGAIVAFREALRLRPASPGYQGKPSPSFAKPSPSIPRSPMRRTPLVSPSGSRVNSTMPPANCEPPFAPIPIMPRPTTLSARSSNNRENFRKPRPPCARPSVFSPTLPEHTTLAAVLRQSGDTAGATAESRAGSELARQNTSEQAAVFATNSGRRLRKAGDLDGAISQFRALSQPFRITLPHILNWDGAATTRQEGRGRRTRPVRNFSAPTNSMRTCLRPPINTSSPS